MGSKNRIAKYIIPILMKNLNDDTWFIDLFSGGCNVIDKINHPKRIANDRNNYLIAMWRYLTSYNLENIFPTEINKDLYSYYRDLFNQRGFKGNSMTDVEARIGWVGFMAPCKGRFFDGGYCGGRKDRDFIKEHINNILRQKEKLMENVMFTCCDYKDFDVPSNSVIYCDIPYKSTKQYSISKNFDYDSFWKWAEEKTEKGNDVIVSEYEAPDNFVCIWQKELNNAINNENTILSTEKLFVHKTIVNKYM